MADAGNTHDKVPWKTALRKDKPVRWCSCGLSSKQPFCDESHRGTAFLPLMFRAPEDMTIAMCGCKKTRRPPYCDGSHIQLNDESAP